VIIAISKKYAQKNLKKPVIIINQKSEKNSQKKFTKKNHSKQQKPLEKPTKNL
jgi:hypothetical protein